MSNDTEKYLRVEIFVKPNSKREGIDLSEEIPLVKVSAPPVKGKANREVISLLSDYLGLPASRIKIIAGLTSGKKSIELGPLDDKSISRIKAKLKIE